MPLQDIGIRTCIKRYTSAISVKQGLLALTLPEVGFFSLAP